MPVAGTAIINAMFDRPQVQFSNMRRSLGPLFTDISRCGGCRVLIAWREGATSATSNTFAGRCDWRVRHVAVDYEVSRSHVRRWHEPVSRLATSGGPQAKAKRTLSDRLK